ncbi:hypothetical protein [Actinoplanes sp. NPDC049681]|uniref:hypothetical protein n=1 Tax=Actinoplanes sp. NPDC049681 TaxID=3363905 RepID=UPI0037AF0A31
MSSAARAVTAAMLVAVGLLSGCTSTRPESVPAAAPARLSEETVDLVTESGTYPEQRWRVRVADETLTARCMRAAGFTWTGSARPPTRRSAAQELADARRHGYGMSDVGAPADPAEKADDKAAGDPRRQAALFGPDNAFARLVIDGHASYQFPRAGCMAQAHIAVYGSLDAWARITYVPQEINLTLGGRARSDARYQGALRGWQTCMAAHHHTYASPHALIAHLARKYRNDREPLAQRRSAEIRLAVQDLTCNQHAGLNATDAALRREYAQDLSPAERAELSTLTHLFARAWQRSQVL